MWHTDWSVSPVPGFPHWIVIDTKAQRSITALSETARTDGIANGRIGQYTIAVSGDGSAWTQVAAGTLADVAGTQVVSFPAVVGRYVKLTALTEAGNRGPWTSAAEIYITGPPWSPVIALPINPAAAALLYNGKVLTWSAYQAYAFGGSNGYTQTATVDTIGVISQRTVTETGHDMFCPGTAILFDGRVLVAGGSNSDKQSVYDPATNTWAAMAPLATPRGYEADVTLSNGKVFTLGGSWNGGVGGKNGEVWTPNASTGVSTSLTGVPVGPFETNDAAGEYRSDNHMWLFAWSNGTVFQAGPSKTMHWIDTSGAGSYSSAGLRGDSNDAMTGTAVMYDAGKIVTMGGSPNYESTSGSPTQATPNAYTIDINGSSPVVTKLSGMSYARAFANSVVLPDGKVLTLGGQTVPVPFSDATSVLTPELWDPATGAFTKMADEATPRNYHSWALLLPDGRVMSGGGQLCNNGCTTEHPNYEIFTPPYLLDASGNPRPRPAIQSAPAAVAVGSTISVTTDSAVTKFSLVRMGSVTHTVDTDQRRIALTPASTGTNTYSLTLPNDPGVIVPGNWMLFAMDASGTPSIAATVTVH